MEENKVTISLKEYIELYEGQKERNTEMQVLLELIFQDTELTSKKELSAKFLEKLKSLNMHYNKETKQYETNKEV